MKASKFYFWTLFLTSLVFFMSMMDSMIVTTASTNIREYFHISLDNLQWALNAYNITIAAVLLVGVSLGDKFGRRKIYNCGILIFTIGSIFCALSFNISLFIVSRIIQGIGASVMTPMSLAILTNSIDNSERGKALGIWSGIGGLALIVGPSLGGFIVSQLSWQWIFWINVPVGIFTILFSRKILPESKGLNLPIRIIDVLLIIVGFTAIILALTYITKTSNMIIPISIAIFGIILGIWFAIRQNKETMPMIPLNLFKSNIFSGGNIATFLLYASMYGVVFFLPQFLQDVAHNNALNAGFKILPWTGTLVFVAPFAGKAVDKLGEKIVAITGLLLQGIGYILIFLFVNSNSSYAVMIFPLIISGAGLSMAGPALQKAILDSVDKKQIGKASGIYNVFRLFGGAVGTAISVIVFYKFGSVISPDLFTNGFKATMLSSGIISIIGIFGCLKFENK